MKLVVQVIWIGADGRGLPSSMTRRGLIGTATGKAPNWSLARLDSRRDGVGWLRGLMAELGHDESSDGDLSLMGLMNGVAWG